MIVANNTKELEQNYNLFALPNDEQIVILGGLKGKSKYNAEKYQMRITYTGYHIKQIISQMKLIESAIPREWNEYQRAKYIYEILGKNIDYNHNTQEHKTQQSSNLTILLSRKGICAGYALLYKEMMDRQGIECDYLRGTAITHSGKVEKHAWNVLSINGLDFSVDLTWGSEQMRRGGTGLEYFGVDKNFEKSHITDPDEKPLHCITYTKESINAIDTNVNSRQNQIHEKTKIDIIELAIDETYSKFKQTSGIDIAKKQVKSAIQQYIEKGKASKFTRQGNARQQLVQYVNQEDMLKSIISCYVEMKDHQTILGNSVNETVLTHGNIHTITALIEYISTGKTTLFTRTNNARKNLNELLTIEEALEEIVDKVVEQKIELIEKSNLTYNLIIDKNTTMYFPGDEFALMQLEDPHIIIKAVQWIKEKMKEKNISEENRKNEKNQMEHNYQKKDEYQQ